MSQASAQRYRQRLRADLSDEMAAHDPRTCAYCTAGAVCLHVTYANLADDLVERRLRRQPGGPS